jgi:hypothetical protein
VKLRAIIATLAIGCVALLAATASPAASAAPPAAPSTSGISIPITTAQSGGVLDGVLTITGFTVNSAGQVVANGTFTGTAVIDGIVQTISTTVTSVVSTSGSCTILDLTLGPLHLDLLGLVVDLNQVHLQITAESGPGNLLGNLLCAVAHLLDSSAVGNALANLLNAILGAL